VPLLLGLLEKEAHECIRLGSSDLHPSVRRPDVATGTIVMW